MDLDIVQDLASTYNSDNIIFIVINQKLYYSVIDNKKTKFKPVIRQHFKIGQTIRKCLIYRQRGDALWIGLMQ